MPISGHSASRLPTFYLAKVRPTSTISVAPPPRLLGLGYGDHIMRKTTAIIAGAIAALITIQFSVQATAQQTQVTEPGTDIGTFYKDEEAPLYKAPGYSPYAGRNYPTRVLWGDTHLHTANSLDAAAFGNTLGPGGGLSGLRAARRSSRQPASG